MADFVFQCSKCGRILEKDHSPDGWEIECKETYSIECCNKDMERIRNKHFVNICFGEHERLSSVMACLPEEIPRMMKAHPGSEYKIDDTGLAKLVIKNRTHKKKEMKRRGYAEL